VRRVGRSSYSCIGICIRQGVKLTSNITFRFNWLLFITLILAQIDSYTLRNTSTPVSIRAYNGLPGSLFMKCLLSLSRPDHDYPQSVFNYSFKACPNLVLSSSFMTTETEMHSRSPCSGVSIPTLPPFSPGPYFLLSLIVCL
jgi:hypothetical protein